MSTSLAMEMGGGDRKLMVPFVSMLPRPHFSIPSDICIHLRVNAYFMIVGSQA